MKPRVLMILLLLIVGCAELGYTQYTLQEDDIPTIIFNPEKPEGEIKFTKDYEQFDSYDLFGILYAILKEIICSDTPFGKKFIERYGIEYEDSLCD